MINKKYINDGRNVSIIDIKLEHYLKFNHFIQKKFKMISNYQSIEWKEKEVYITPYILGVWIGCGSDDGESFKTKNKLLLNQLATWLQTIECILKKAAFDPEAHNIYVKYCKIIHSKDKESA